MVSMSTSTVKFDLSLDDSSDGESIFITQTPKVNATEMLNKSEDEVNLNFEDLM